MSKLKSIISLFLIVSIIFSLSACSEAEQEEANTRDPYIIYGSCIVGDNRIAVSFPEYSVAELLGISEEEIAEEQELCDSARLPFEIYVFAELDSLIYKGEYEFYTTDDFLKTGVTLYLCDLEYERDLQSESEDGDEIVSEEVGQFVYSILRENSTTIKFTMTAGNMEKTMERYCGFNSIDDDTLAEIYDNDTIVKPVILTLEDKRS